MVSPPVSITTPAPFVLALVTGDVVATCELVGLDAALGTGLDPIVPAVLLKLCITHVGTSRPLAVVRLTAIATNLLAALTDSSLREAARSAHEVHAALAGAPAEIGVPVNLDVQLETHVFLVNFL